MDNEELLPCGPLDRANLEVVPIRDGEEIVDGKYYYCCCLFFKYLKLF